MGTPATVTTTSGPLSASSSAPMTRTSCPPPEIVFNGSLLQTDSSMSQQFGNVYEVRFMGLFGGVTKKRACKIKCVNGVWLGPLCAVESEAGENAYTTLKQLLISCLTPSEPQRLQQLLHHTELGDRTPSQLLRHMRQLLHTDGATTTDADSRLLRELFLQRLPVNVRMILASAADKRLSDLAELADSVLAVAPPSVAALQPDIAGRAPTTALHDTWEQISRLADTVAAMQARSTPEERQHGGRFHSVLKSCPLAPLKPHLVVHHEGRPLTVTGLSQMAHESVLSFRCTQLGRYKFVGNATVRCLNGQWSAAMPSCLETSQQSNFSECEVSTGSVTAGAVLLSQKGSPTSTAQTTLACGRVGTSLPVLFDLASPSMIFPYLLESRESGGLCGAVQVPPTILYSVEKGDHGVSEEGELVVYPETNVYLYCLYQRFSGNPQWAWTSQRDYAKGWILSADEKQWRYELLIYKAKEHDSGTYTCTTPRGQTNEIHVKVRDVTCPPIEGYGDENRVTSDHGNQMHSKAKFACMEGYNLVGSEEVVCSPSGRWSDKAPHCVVIQCPTIPTTGHLKMSTHNRTYGIRVHFSCPSNYRLLGPPFVTCWKNESWSDTPPTCEPIRCRSPLPPAHGRVLYGGRQYPGDSVHYTCNAGYVLIGESVSVCQANGTWSNNLPKCKPACEFPGQPAHARVVPSKFHYDIGELVTVACNAGFRLLGSAQLRCSRDGHWSHPLPHCRRLVLHK
ncbi:hypothetical protein HPB50_008501 [Hyalomma asiaticum]|uniref:Uncharacterized protein n=1 Tax=Hyalomma asiaticum TaxID=266040 RepID=A0ACB7TGK6_HYAAI|nr:hypothetical protein HPB50_008501 [Hyalomma asiaticum]